MRAQARTIKDISKENKETNRTCVRKGQQGQAMQNLYTRVGSLNFIVSA